MFVNIPRIVVLLSCTVMLLGVPAGAPLIVHSDDVKLQPLGIVDSDTL